MNTLKRNHISNNFDMDNNNPDHNRPFYPKYDDEKGF